MIEKYVKAQFPKYSPDISLNIRGGRNSRFHDAILWEYSIGSLSKYITNFEAFFRDGINFLKCRGTLFSMRLALKWVGFQEVKIIRLSQKSYEIDPGKPFTTLQTKAIEAACLQSAPASAVLKRIFHLSQSVSL
ncbi:MAG: hypothetical protein EOP04_13050 [Proteobacteria bacterium]|nr:MAG: hypothetical protein EOP04_13050 [Pseudomonadota bacterium]